ncbi:hypothetical protein SD1D_0458 [Herbinix luporum]|jgi:hypothetical protein|uniref:Uncharacterized protein n=1 Tax=Herbinix luporum TaxID=1679721 RepID=A0A0K8J3E0_9FIRM|nr:hypothetical protein SD1D_0458 [Herbinix luporum]
MSRPIMILHILSTNMREKYYNKLEKILRKAYYKLNDKCRNIF